jgi:hypothetical protein
VSPFNLFETPRSLGTEISHTAYFFQDRQNLESSFLFGGRLGYNFTKNFKLRVDLRDNYEPIPENIYSAAAKADMRVLFEVIVKWQHAPGACRNRAKAGSYAAV